MAVATASTQALTSLPERQRWNFKLVVFLCCFREAGPSRRALRSGPDPANRTGVRLVPVGGWHSNRRAGLAASQNLVSVLKKSKIQQQQEEFWSLSCKTAKTTF